MTSAPDPVATPEQHGGAPSRCPRCATAFDCGVATPGCACMGVTLSAAQRAALAGRYDRCLCLDCLRAVAAGEAVQPEPGHPRPLSAAALDAVMVKDALPPP